MLVYYLRLYVFLLLLFSEVSSQSSDETHQYSNPEESSTTVRGLIEATKNGHHVAARKQRKQRVTKKYKEPRKTKAKVKKVLKHSQDLSVNCAENESSIGEMYNTNQRIYKTPSQDSVIYMGHYYPESRDRHNIPLIDLTHSTDNFSTKENTDPMILKTLYFPERNFLRKGHLCKFLKTTSLINIPVMKKIEITPKLKSFTDLTARDATDKKLSVLGLPDKLIDDDSYSVSPEALEKSKLTVSDYDMINWIIENDRQVHPMEITGSSSTSGYNSSIETGMSVEELVKVYDVQNANDFQ